MHAVSDSSTNYTGDAIPDSITGGTGNDQLDGGAGDDTMFGNADADSFTWTATSLGSGDITANGVDDVSVDSPEEFQRNGVTAEPDIGGTPLHALTADTNLGSVIDANNAIAYTGMVIQIDVNLDGAFNAPNDFQIDINSSAALITTVTYGLHERCADICLTWRNRQ